MASKPTTALLAYETSCNLKCITCREDFKIADTKELENINVLVDKVKEQLMPWVEFLITAGDGEVLLCKSYRDIIMSDSIKNIKYLRLLTNGMSKLVSEGKIEWCLLLLDQLNMLELM